MRWLILLLLLPVAFADSCFTVLDSPSGDVYYWKAVSYSKITDAGLVQEEISPHIPDPLGLNQHNIRVDKDCFGGYLLTTNTMTGADSGNMYLTIWNGDLKAPSIAVNKLYTVSLGEDEKPSTGRISEIASNSVDGVDYIAGPATAWSEGVCLGNGLVKDQMYLVRDAVWERLSYGKPACSSSQTYVQCIEAKLYGTSEHYSTMVALLARKCGVPARVVYGVSEGKFQGSDLMMNEDKLHYWVEYYDNGWHTFEATESGLDLPSKLETNCKDRLDNDKDAAVDCLDTDCRDACSVQPLVVPVVTNITQPNITVQNDSMLPVIPKSTFTGNEYLQKGGKMLSGIWDWFIALPLQTKGIIIGVIVLIWFLLRRS